MISHPLQLRRKFYVHKNISLTALLFSTTTIFFQFWSSSSYCHQQLHCHQHDGVWTVGPLGAFGISAVRFEQAEELYRQYTTVETDQIWRNVLISSPEGASSHSVLLCRRNVLPKDLGGEGFFYLSRRVRVSQVFFLSQES